MMPKIISQLLILLVAAAGMPTVPAAALQTNFQQGQERYQQADWQAALDLFLAAIEESLDATDEASAHFYAAECGMQLKDYAQAQAHYQHVLESDAGKAFHPRAQFRSSEAHFLAGELPQAASQFREFVEQYPEHELVPAAYNYLGEIALQSSQHEQAIASFDYVIENFRLGPEIDRTRLGLARTLLASARLAEVPIALGRLCQSETADTAAEALLLLGRTKYELQDFDQALATFRRVYSLPANLANQHRARLGTGWSLWKLSRCEEIAAEIAPLAKEPESATEYHYLLGVTAYSAKDWGIAEKELKQAAAEQSAHRPAALFYLGESLLEADKPRDAKQAFQQLIDSESASEWADDAAWGLARTARAAKSQTDLQRACELLQSKFPASEYLALVPALVAAEDFVAVENTPGFGLFEEAVGLERDGHFNAALAAYRAFLAEKNSDMLQAEGLWRTARLHEWLKQHTEAINFYSRLLTDFPKFDRTPEAIAKIAWIEATNGKQAAAKKHCQVLVANFPQSPQAAEAAYWLALAAADEKKCDEAQQHVEWLLARLTTEKQDLTAQQMLLWEQTLCLQCQLLADADKWQAIDELLEQNETRAGNGAAAARLAFWRAEATLRLGEHAEASERFDALIAQTVGVNEPWVPMVTLRRAQLAARREDWRQVLKLVGELDERHPEFELAYECDYLRGRALAGRGEMSAARTAYGQVLTNDWATGTETAAMAQWMIGETYFHQQDYEHATVAYQKVIERHNLPEWQARAALQAGKCAELTENWEAARLQYSRALERWQGSTSEKQLAGRLKWAQERVAQQQATLRR
ncbi:MAG: tetratricopeptide repeat protein [Bythopirellula sp.]|nr:tetratricopeptide repeat protein [Bythopirellula sp.]